MSAIDGRRGPARWILARRERVDVLTCGHGIAPNRSELARHPSRAQFRLSRERRRCWKCRAGFPAEYVVTPRMRQEARAEREEQRNVAASD